MNKSQFIFLTLIAVIPRITQTKNDSTLNRIIEKTNEKVKAGAQTVANWLEYFRDNSEQTLTDWVEYCRHTAPTKSEAFASYMIDEKDVEFAKLSLKEQEAIRDLNKFYNEMKVASKEQERKLIKNFAHRFKEIQKILKDAQ